MVELGLKWVSKGDFEWLDRVINILGQPSMKVVLGTPTTAPTKWAMDKFPDMLAPDKQGMLRKFVSRRHFYSSHIGFKEQSCSIVTQLARRHSINLFVAAWQIDNEYGCHDTSISYLDVANSEF